MELVEEIVLRDINEYDFITDGRVEDDGRKVILTSRCFELLPNYDIARLYRNRIFRIIVNTLYHELGHANDMKIYPNLYKAAFDDTNRKEMLTALFWLEYLAEKRTASTNVENTTFCMDFAERNWKPSICNMQDATLNNFFYLNKAIPYFLAREEVMTDCNYLDLIKDHILRSYLIALKKELARLEEIAFFDNTKELEDLYEIMNVYYKKFMKLYR